MVDIGDVAHTTGLSTATLRYYEERGLIESVGRKGLRRQYDELVFERLALIALGQEAGFSLAEIVDLLPAGNDRDLDRAALGTRVVRLPRAVARGAMLATARRVTLTPGSATVGGSGRYFASSTQTSSR